MFDRTKRSVLTDAATRMLPDIQADLEILSRAVNSKGPPIGERTLAISVAPSFASKWLLQRLPSFYDRHADIDLRILATFGLADFKRDRVDLAIRLGHGSYPGLRAEPLFAEAFELNNQSLDRCLHGELGQCEQSTAFGGRMLGAREGQPSVPGAMLACAGNGRVVNQPMLWQVVRLAQASLALQQPG